MGSTFKAFTVAMALDSGSVTLADGYDASEPLRLARFRISDYHAEGRWLSVPEIFMHSSNIGAAKMALAVGADAQREFLGRFGLLEALPIELPETGHPLPPKRWGDIAVATVAFGHGIAVSSLQLAAGVAALVNGGVWRPPTLIARNGPPPPGRRVLRERTSRQMRQLFRLVVAHGTGGKADAAGWRVGGKTGTAEKLTDGRYDGDRLVSSFVAAFPMDAPRYVVLVVIDEPRGIEETFGYATAGWTAAPTVGRIVERIGPHDGARAAPCAGERCAAARRAALRCLPRRQRDPSCVFLTSPTEAGVPAISISPVLPPTAARSVRAGCSLRCPTTPPGATLSSPTPEGAARRPCWRSRALAAPPVAPTFSLSPRASRAAATRTSPPASTPRSRA